MVLEKWAVVSRSGMASWRLRPRSKTVSTHPRLVPKSYKTPYVLREFIRDQHLSDIQHIENQGMYMEELQIERSRHPSFTRSFLIQTDGSINDFEWECNGPPLILLYQDRMSSHRQQQLQMMKLKKSSNSMPWFYSSDVVNRSSELSSILMCNALEFPYCVPQYLPKRKVISSSLKQNEAKNISE